MVSNTNLLSWNPWQERGWSWHPGQDHGKIIGRAWQGYLGTCHGSWQGYHCFKHWVALSLCAERLDRTGWVRGENGTDNQNEVLFFMDPRGTFMDPKETTNFQSVNLWGTLRNYISQVPIKSLPVSFGKRFLQVDSALRNDCRYSLLLPRTFQNSARQV